MSRTEAMDDVAAAERLSRGKKDDAMALLLAAMGEGPGAVVLYLAESAAKVRIVLGDLKRLSDTYGLACAYDHATATVSLSGGSSIKLRCACHPSDVHRLRGMRISSAVVDDRVSSDLREMTAGMVRPSRR